MSKADSLKCLRELGNLIVESVGMSAGGLEDGDSGVLEVSKVCCDHIFWSSDCGSVEVVITLSVVWDKASHTDSIWGNCCNLDFLNICSFQLCYF